MSGAASARAAIAAVAQRLYGPLYNAAQGYGRMHHDLMGSTDLTDTLRYAVELVLSGEALEGRAKQTVATLRDKIAEVMKETGAVVDLEHFSPYLTTASDDIEFLGDVPDEFMVQPPPRKDMSKIRQHLQQKKREGKAVPWARLIGNGRPVLNIRAKKEKAA